MGRKNKSYPFQDHKTKFDLQDHVPHIIMMHFKCIIQSLCIKFENKMQYFNVVLHCNILMHASIVYYNITLIFCIKKLQKNM